MFVQWLPMLGLTSFFVIGVLWRGWLQYRRYGTTGIVVFGSNGWRQRIRDASFTALFAAVTAQTVLFAIRPAMLSRMVAVASPECVVWVGAVLLLAGLALTAAAQLGMGVSWRIGIDRDASPGLVTSGLYQFCRNPIYLGMIASLIGLTMMLTTWLSLALAAAVIWVIRSQTIEEEAYLEQTYGSEFRRYAAQVGRFWPGLGRLTPFGVQR